MQGWERAALLLLLVRSERSTAGQISSSRRVSLTKNSATPLRNVGFKWEAPPRDSMPFRISDNLRNGRKPQILFSGFSRSLKVGLSNSCSTLDRLSSGATRYRLMSRLG